MESWNSTLKSELGERFESYAAAKEQLFDYIEVFYNQQRRHSALGYESPVKALRSPPCHGTRYMTYVGVIPIIAAPRGGGARISAFGTSTTAPGRADTNAATASA